MIFRGNKWYLISLVGSLLGTLAIIYFTNSYSNLYAALIGWAIATFVIYGIWLQRIELREGKLIMKRLFWSTRISTSDIKDVKANDRRILITTKTDKGISINTFQIHPLDLKEFIKRLKKLA